MSAPSQPIEVRWHDGAGFAVYHGAGLRLTEPPPGFAGALAVDFVPNGVGTTRFYGAMTRPLTQDERDTLMRRLVAMSCGAWDAWEGRSPTLVVVFPPGTAP